MWFRIGPPLSSHAAATARSDSTWILSSWGVTGNGNGGRAASASLKDSKQRSGVLRLMPRGSNPTRSKRALTSAEKRAGPASRTRSTPEPPGPPGLRNIEPILAPGPDAGSLMSDSEISAPRGRS
jgi:hypothetical protein